MVLQLLILALLLFAAPLLAGGIFVNMDKGAGRLPFLWASGQICLWAGFQMICVPQVLWDGSLSRVVYLFSGYSILAAMLGAIRLFLSRKRKEEADIPEIRAAGARPDRAVTALWVVFAAGLLFQIVQAMTMAYADGDDAFYVAVSTIIRDNDVMMYRKLPYTGGTTTLDARHGLAPFPVWIAYLARLSGMETVSAAHLVLPAALIALSYAVFYLLGRQLFPEKDRRLPLFMIFTELLVLFGDYSSYTMENFMIARSRQGKAALGSIVIPFLFYLLFLWLRSLERKEKLTVSFYLLLTGVMFSGCLCSTLGALLICILTGIVGLLGAVSYKRWAQLIPMALCCVPCVCYAVLYLIQD